MSSLLSLVRATLAHTFGGGGRRPGQAAVWRLSGLAVGALIVGALLSQGIRQLPLAAMPQAELLAMSAAVATQISVALALLAASGTMRPDRQERFAQLLLVWPLRPSWRQFLIALPGLILGLLTLLILASPLLTLFGRLGLAWPYLAIGMAAGYMSAYGLVLSPWRRWPQLVVAWLPGIIWLEYELLCRINNPFLPHGLRWLAVGGVALILTGLVAAALNHQASLHGLTKAQASRRITWLRLPPRLWFIAKLLRRSNFVLSVLVALSMSLGLVAAQHYGLNDPEALSLLVALLVASVATDLRATARKHNPAEITALRGTTRFMSNVVLAAVSLGCLMTAPILVAGWGVFADQPTMVLLHLGFQPVIGVFMGVLAGTVIVPEGRDISSQFASTLLVIMALVLLPQLPGISQLELQHRNLLEAGLCFALIIVTLAIEFKRNPYKWRLSHAAQ